MNGKSGTPRGRYLVRPKNRPTSIRSPGNWIVPGGDQPLSCRIKKEPGASDEGSWWPLERLLGSRMSGNSRATFCFLIRPLVCVRVQLLLAKISDTCRICKALLGPFHCYTPLVTWKDSRQWSDFTHLQVTQAQAKAFLPRRFDLVPCITICIV